MRKLFVLLLLLVVVACQPQSKPAATATGAASAARPVVAPGEPAAPQPATAPPVHAPANDSAAAFLRSYDLSPLFLPGKYEDNTRLHLNGFYGPSHYRMELVITSVQRDPAHPNRYFLAVKDRYKKIITPLAGYVDFTDSGQCPPDGQIGDALQLACTVQGTYELREDSTVHGAGVFRGQLAADVGIGRDHSVERTSIFGTPADGGILTFAGKWTSLSTGQQLAATWVVDALGYHGPQTASDFSLGDRVPQLNPKYAKFGWSEFWENDEWWVESPSAVASGK